MLNFGVNVRSPRALAKIPYFFTRYFAIIFMILDSIGGPPVSPLSQLILV
jgi:hypothetical protein